MFPDTHHNRLQTTNSAARVDVIKNNSNLASQRKSVQTAKIKPELAVGNFGASSL